MFQLLIDHTDMNALTALYVGLQAGIAIRFLLAWSIEYPFVHHASERESSKIIQPYFLWKKKSRFNKNFILVRIIKYIRRKRSSQGDSEEPLFTLSPSMY